IWIPFIQIKKALVGILGFKYKLRSPWPFEGLDELFAEAGQSCSCSMQLPVSGFGDIKLLENSSIDNEETEKSYSVFMTEFGDEDTMKKALVGFLGFELKLARMHWPLESSDELFADGGKHFCSCSLQQLPADRYQDIQVLDDGSCCSICLTEFEDEDMVTQLSECRHVFHLDCIQKWIHMDKLTCPICRSFLLSSDAVRCRDCLCNSTSFADSVQSSVSPVSSLYW
ncbi:Zinc finger, RING-type, partial [Dillenia turbinata]